MTLRALAECGLVSYNHGSFSQIYKPADAQDWKLHRSEEVAMEDASTSVDGQTGMRSLAPQLEHTSMYVGG